MRKFYIISFLIVFASACQTHNPDASVQELPSGRYIFIDAEVAGTKADNRLNQLPGQGNTSFCVFGFRPDNTTPIFDMYSQGVNSAFDNVAVMYRNGLNRPFMYDGLALWHGGEHKFYGFYYAHRNKDDYKYDLISDMSASPDPYITYNQPSTIEGMIDIMTASKSANPSDGPVVLSFDHRLFALDVIVRNDQVVSTPLKITSAKIEFFNIASEADFYFNGNVVHRGNISPTHTYDVTDQNINRGRTFNLNDDTSFLLIPCTSLKIRITIDIIDEWGLSKEIVIDRSTDEQALRPDGGFVAGNIYELTIAKKNGEIEFEYEVQDWYTKDVNMDFN